MKHRFYILLFVILAAGSSQLYAQTIRLAEPKMGDTLFGQIFWEDKDYYISYDKLWFRKWQYMHLSTSVGFWYEGHRAPQSWYFNKLWKQMHRMQLSVLAGKNGHYAVVGITRYYELNHGRDPLHFGGWYSSWETIYDYLHVGYRYQHPNGGLFFQGLLFVPFCCSGFTLVPYETFSLGLGITLPIKAKRRWYLPEGYLN